MVPLNAPLASRQYAEGETYQLEPEQERSQKSHRHYFAATAEVWKNLPEEMADKIPSPEHLRKWALIKCGYYKSRSIACGSPEEAQKVAAFVRPIDEFAIIAVSDSVVTVGTAQSQSIKEMGRVKFQESKDKVLVLLASLIGVSVDDLNRNTGTSV